MINAGLIDEAVASFFNTITQNVSDFWTAHFDPFYGLIALGVLVILAVTFIAWALSWYFGITVFRPLAGAITFAIIFGLYAFRKGEAAQKKIDDAKAHLKSTTKPKPKPRDDGGFHF